MDFKKLRDAVHAYSFAIQQIELYGRAALEKTIAPGFDVHSLLVKLDEKRRDTRATIRGEAYRLASELKKAGGDCRSLLKLYGAADASGFAAIAATWPDARATLEESEFENDTPTEETPDQEGKAIAFFLKNTGAKLSAIAAAAGCQRTSLYRMDRFMVLWNGRGQHIHKGMKGEVGIEAIDE